MLHRQPQKHMQTIEQKLKNIIQFLAVELDIPVPAPQENLMNLYFAYDCLNGIMGRTSENWQRVEFVGDERDVDRWKEFIEILQDRFLEDGVIIEQQEEITVDHIVTAFQVLSQRCEQMRQLSVGHTSVNRPLKNQPAKQLSKQQLKQPSKQRPNQKTKQKNNKSNNPPNSQPTPSLKQQSQMLKNQQIKNLQEQVLDTITKTMNKTAQHKTTKPTHIADNATDKANRQFHYTVNQHQKQNHKTKIRAASADKHRKPSIVDHCYLKAIQMKHKRLNDNLQNQQLRYYVQLRDKKIAYIRHIHKLVEKLERQRVIEANKLQLEQHRHNKKQLCQKIEQTDNIFKNNIQHLKQTYQQRRKAKAIEQIEQINICRTMEKNIKHKKMQQMQEIEIMWNAQCEKLHRVSVQQENMKKKLIEIYKKHCK